MDFGIFVPLLLPLVSWPIVRILRSGVSPEFASWLFTGAALVLSIGSTVVLALLAFAGLAPVPAVARLGGWSPQTPLNVGTTVPVGVCCGAALLAIALSVLNTGCRFLWWTVRLRRGLERAAGREGLVVMPNDDPLAVALPVHGGLIVVSRGVLAALDSRETCALLAHERAHLRCRHHLFLAVVTLSTVLNPLVWPLRSAAVFSLERWADEVAARRVGDRRVVATAVAKAALASTKRTRFALAAAGGSVPRRVSALLQAPAPRRYWPWLTALCVGATVAITAWSAQATVEAAADLHTGIEIATSSAGHHPRPTT
jgi:Zn-dependent protease with chaperone function